MSRLLPHADYTALCRGFRRGHAPDLNMAAHSYPREIAFPKALPMTVTGKVMRPEFPNLAKGKA